MSDIIVCDFVFVPNGAPWPADWVRRHPDYITLPARFTGSPAAMARIFGGRRLADRYMFDKTALTSPQLGADGANPAARPPAPRQPGPRVEVTAEAIPTAESISAGPAVPWPSAGHGDERAKRDIWTGLTKDDLLGPGLADLERKAGGEDVFDFVAGPVLGLGEGQFGAADARSRSGDPGPVRTAAVGDLKCDGFSGSCSNGGSRGTTGMYGVNGLTLCTNCAIKILGFGNQTAREQVDTLMRYILPGR